MTYLVFARSALDLDAVAAGASKYFGCTVERTGAGTARVSLPDGQQAAFGVKSRAVTRDDRHAVREAEARGDASGMGVVADLCTHVWEVAFQDNASSPALFTALAALSFSALGPVLPPDRSTLFAVRGARERASAGS